MKSTFLLRSIINNQNLPPKAAIDLFRKLIVPIETYGSKIWDVPSGNLFKKNS